jgi:hypothetical protein
MTRDTSKAKAQPSQKAPGFDRVLVLKMVKTILVVAFYIIAAYVILALVGFIMFSSFESL